jgi:hypothetical protein
MINVSNVQKQWEIIFVLSVNYWIWWIRASFIAINVGYVDKVGVRISNIVRTVGYVFTKVNMIV